MIGRRLYRSERGSLLVAGLLLFSLLLVLGLGLMSSQTARVKAARSQTEAAQAKALAMAGWEDVRVKLGKDILFPQSAETQTYFSYSENVYDSETPPNYVGSYTVIVDLRWHSISRNRIVGFPNPAAADYQSAVFEHQSIYPITCIGKVGSARVGQVTSERTLYFELDMVNWKVIRVEDRGSL